MFTVTDIARATGGTIHGTADAMVTGVSTDSRKVATTELFVPLKGERFDGHNFIAAAVGRGVRVFLAETGWAANNQVPAGASVVAVRDTLRALGDLAAFQRRRYILPVVGITGSNGKTTTKEMLAGILTYTGPGLKTTGNLNNLIGLPQMLFQLQDTHRWAVLEMGMSEPGEIDRLAEIAAPSVGIITNAFPAHLASMGSVEAVAKAKGELFLRLPVGGFAIYNADDLRIAACPVANGVQRLSFGLHGAEVSATEIKSLGNQGQSFTLRLPGRELPVTLRAFGRHNIYNALAAAAAAFALGVKPQLIREGLELFTPYDKRFNLEEVGELVLIDDSYNANPSSMAAALITLLELKGKGRAVAVLGDMLELGEGEVEAHREVGKLAATCVERLYLLGNLAEEVAAGAMAAGLSASTIVVAKDHGELTADLLRNKEKGDYILVKGSRGMRMELVAEGIRGAQAPPVKKGVVG